MPDATAAGCAQAFLDQWVPRFGLPSFASSDNGPAFVASIWKNLQEALGIAISFSPPLHPESLGGLERQHRDLKLGIKTMLLQMADSHLSRWAEALPWTLLARRTDFQQDLGACPAELVFSDVPRIPGNLVQFEEGPAIHDLLDKLRCLAAKEPIQTSHHRKASVYTPKSAQDASHTFVKKGKPTILGPIFEGPFEIDERLGQTCLKVRTGSWVNGTPRFETLHWNNCVPAFGRPSQTAVRAKRGRKSLNPEAMPFEP